MIARRQNPDRVALGKDDLREDWPCSISKPFAHARRRREICRRTGASWLPRATSSTCWHERSTPASCRSARSCIASAHGRRWDSVGGAVQVRPGIRASAPCEPFDLIIGLVKTWYQHAYIAVGGAHPASLEANSRRFRSPWRALVVGRQRAQSQAMGLQMDRCPGSLCGAYAACDRAGARRLPRIFSVTITWPASALPSSLGGLDISQEPAEPRQARVAFRQQHELNADDVAILFVGA